MSWKPIANHKNKTQKRLAESGDNNIGKRQENRATGLNPFGYTDKDEEKRGVHVIGVHIFTLARSRVALPLPCLLVRRYRCVRVCNCVRFCLSEAAGV